MYLLALLPELLAKGDGDHGDHDGETLADHLHEERVVVSVTIKEFLQSRFVVKIHKLS